MISELLIVAGLAGAPEAEDGPAALHDVRIHWNGSPECDGERDVGERLTVLAPELTTGEPALLNVNVSVERRPDLHWSVELDLDGPQGREHRVFVAESCVVAIDATALLLAVAVDPVAVVAELERQDEPVVASTTPLAAPQAPRQAPARAREELPLIELTEEPTRASSRSADIERRWRGRLGVGVLGGGGYGPLRAGSATLMGRVALIGPRWRWDLRAAWLPPVRPALGDRGRARVDGFSIGTRGCGLLMAGPVEFPLCAGLEAGAIRARALDPIQNAETASQPYLGLLLGPGLSWAPIRRLALGLEVEALIPLVSGGFALDGQPVLGDVAVGVRALAGVEIRIP